MSDETRTTSATGGSKGVKLARVDMIPPKALLELAEHYGKGADKYGPTENGRDNWRNGYEWHKSYGALGRHLLAFWGGEDIDPETGSKHIIAVAWHALTLATWMDDPDLRSKYDDRDSTLSARQGKDWRDLWVG